MTIFEILKYFLQTNCWHRRWWYHVHILVSPLIGLFPSVSIDCSRMSCPATACSYSVDVLLASAAAGRVDGFSVVAGYRRPSSSLLARSSRRLSLVAYSSSVPTCKGKLSLNTWRCLTIKTYLTNDVFPDYFTFNEMLILSKDRHIFVHMQLEFGSG